MTAGVWEAAKTATGLRTRLSAAGECPPELAEATAALQDLALRLAPPTERDRRLAELWELQAGLPAMIQTARNGPYLGHQRAQPGQSPGHQHPAPGVERERRPHRPARVSRSRNTCRRYDGP